jgi:RNA polymerase sigma-70 factor (ECF subfamily)
VNVQLVSDPLMAGAADEDAGREGWLASFRAGERATLEQCYRRHYRRVVSLVGRMLTQADAETVTHETFYRILADASLRASYQGGSFSAWLSRVANNAAIDHLRRSRKEQPEGQARPRQEEEALLASKRSHEEAEARLLVERFRREHLPPKWEAVFEARFLRQLPQREAARSLGMHRTTLVYQESRIRALLKRFLLTSGAS